MNLILTNLKSDKTKYILLPAALNVVMKHSPEYKVDFDLIYLEMLPSLFI